MKYTSFINNNLTFSGELSENVTELILENTCLESDHVHTMLSKLKNKRVVRKPELLNISGNDVSNVPNYLILEGHKKIRHFIVDSYVDRLLY